MKTLDRELDAMTTQTFYQISGGRWILADYRDGRYYAPCRSGGEDFGSLEYVASPASNHYVYASRASARRAAKRDECTARFMVVR